MTEVGFVRVSSNRSAIPGAVTPTEALTLLERICDLPGHEHLPDDVSGVVGEHLERERITSHLHVADAHLVALARRHGAKLATFDRGIAALAGGSDVVLIPFD
jgi:predicted nucleic acid-binding protein